MYLPKVDLHQAASLDEAAALKREYGSNARFLAGGTDVLVDLKIGRFECDHLISLGGLQDLRGVSMVDGALHIGALTTITQLCRSSIVQSRFQPVLDAARSMAAPQVRNLATVGGNVAGAVPCADLPPILMVMDADVLLWSPSGERRVPMRSFFAGPRQTLLQDDEILIAIRVPNPPARFGAAYERFALRDGNAIAVAGVAAAILLDDGDEIQGAAVALGAVAPSPTYVEAASVCLIGHPPNETVFSLAALAAMEAADPITDIRGTAEYRREIVGILTQRALETACRRAKEAAR